MESKAAAPPYQSSARFADSQCYPQYTASLKCKATAPFFSLSLFWQALLFIACLMFKNAPFYT